MTTIPPADLAAEIMRQTTERGLNASICPSEVARALAEEWRPLLGPVRLAAFALALDGRIEILRKGKPVDPFGVRGVIRLRLRDPAAPMITPKDTPTDDVPE
jgi:hypothetical protein